MAEPTDPVLAELLSALARAIGRLMADEEFERALAEKPRDTDEHQGPDEE